MRPDEAFTFLAMHERSVRGLAARYYPPDVIERWAASPTEERVLAVLKNPDDETRLIAELDGEPVGLGTLVIAKSELRACYVVPEAARKGVGSAIVREIERLAENHGVTALELESSINAESFYAALGYAVIERHDLALRSGITMQAVKMRKAIGNHSPRMRSA